MLEREADPAGNPADGKTCDLESAHFVTTVLHPFAESLGAAIDVKGYPVKLKGTRIPLGARIIALADLLSAMLQNRPYRRAMGFAKAFDEILRCSGTQFDPLVVDVFIKSADTIQASVSFLSDREQAA